MAFSIEFLDEHVPDLEPGVRASFGLIQIGDFQERFIASLMYWTKKDYARHWRQAIGRTVTGSERSCLITSIVDPASSNLLFWWPMYRIEQTVLLQNQLLVFDQLNSTFSANDPYVHVPDHKTVNADGERISEWSVPLQELDHFLLKLSSGYERES